MWNNWSAVKTAKLQSNHKLTAKWFPGDLVDIQAKPGYLAQYEMHSVGRIRESTSLHYVPLKTLFIHLKSQFCFCFKQYLWRKHSIKATETFFYMYIMTSYITYICFVSLGSCFCHHDIYFKRGRTLHLWGIIKVFSAWSLSCNCATTCVCALTV